MAVEAAGWVAVEERGLEAQVVVGSEMGDVNLAVAAAGWAAVEERGLEAQVVVGSEMEVVG